MQEEKRLQGDLRNGIKSSGTCLWKDEVSKFQMCIELLKTRSEGLMAIGEMDWYVELLATVPAQNALPFNVHTVLHHSATCHINSVNQA